MTAQQRIKPETVEQELERMDAATLHSAMASAFAEIEAATRTGANDAFKRNGKASKYATLEDVIGAVKPALIAHGLWFTQHCHPSPDGVSVETVLHHRRGESLSLGTIYVPANKRDAHGFGSANTYARRYGLQTAFGVPAEDDDGNAAVAAMRQDKVPDGGNPTSPRLAGDMSDSALRGCIKTLVHNINGCASLREFEELLELQEVIDTIEQCKRRFPAWWETGEGCPPEFKPLKKILEETRQGLKDLEDA